MKGVQEFLAWLNDQNDVVQTVTVVVAFALLIVCASTLSRWLGGKK